MPCCDTGRNVQKYKGGGGGASTLQEALENGNIATVAIELQSNGLFIGDGGGLSNIAGVGGSVGNIQQVTTSGATTSNKIILTNTNESLETSGNVKVNSGKFYLGDGGLLSNTAGTITLQQASNQGNVINNTVSFTNAAESIVTTGKIVVGTSLEATNVNGNGSGLSSLNASNVSSGTIHNDRLDTKTGTGNIVMSASPTLSGTITGGTFSGTHDGNGSGLSSLNASNVSSGTIHNDRLDTKTGTGNIVMSASPTLSGTITGGTFSGTHTGTGSGLSSLNASNISSGTIHNDRLDTKTGTGNIVMSASPTLSGTITGGTFSGTHDGDGSGLSSLNASNVSTGTLSNDRLGTVPYNKGGTGQTSYIRGDIVYSDADNSLAKLAVGTESGMFLRSDGTDVSWSSDGSRLTNLYLNDANVNSSSTLSATRGGTGLSGIGTYKLLYTKNSANTVNELAWNGQDDKYLRVNSDGTDLTWANASGSGGTSGQTTESLTATGWLLGDAFDGDPTREWSVKASVANTTGTGYNHLVAREASTGNVYVGNVIIGTNVLSATEWSGKSSTVTVGTDTSGTERDLAFVDGDSILKDDGGKLKWKPNSGELYIGPSSGTRTKLTNTKWFGESAKVTINNTTASSVAAPVLIHEADGIVRKDTSNRLTWTATGTHAGTLTIGTIGGDHSNITASTFTGESANVKITSNTHSTPLNIALTNTTDSNTHIVKDTDGDFTYKPDDGTLKIKSGTLESIITPSTFSGESANVEVTEHTSDTDLNIALIKETVSNTHIVRDTDGEFKYNPDTGTITATNFSGNLPAGNITGEVPADHGGTGFNSYDIGNMLYAGTTTSFTKIGPPGGNNETKFLKYVTNGSGGLSSIGWGDPSVSQISITNDTTSTGVHGITFADGTGAQTIKSDESTLHYKPSIGTLTTSNLITSGTSQFNGIANGNPTHTLSVGTVVSIQETSTGDVLIVRGNGFFNNDVYIAKKLTMPAGSTLVADTIKVRSHNVKETMVVAERPESQVSA